MTERTKQFLDAVRDALDEQAKAVAADVTDPAAFLEVLGRHGLTIVSAVTGPPGPESLDTHAIVDLLGHTRRTGRLTHSAQIPGFLELHELEGDVRLINPRTAVFEIQIATEAEARARNRPTAPWGEMVGDDYEDYPE